MCTHLRSCNYFYSQLDESQLDEELNKDNKKKWQDLMKGLCTWAFLFVCNKVQIKMKMHRDLLCGS